MTTTTDAVVGRALHLFPPSMLPARQALPPLPIDDPDWFESYSAEKRAPPLTPYRNSENSNVCPSGTLRSRAVANTEKTVGRNGARVRENERGYIAAWVWANARGWV
jgi:hypothetical protein